MELEIKSFGVVPLLCGALLPFLWEYPYVLTHPAGLCPGVCVSVGLAVKRKNLLPQETRFSPGVWKVPWRRK